MHKSFQTPLAINIELESRHSKTTPPQKKVIAIGGNSLGTPCARTVKVGSNCVSDPANKTDLGLVQPISDAPRCSSPQ